MDHINSDTTEIIGDLVAQAAGFQGRLAGLGAHLDQLQAGAAHLRELVDGLNAEDFDEDTRLVELADQMNLVDREIRRLVAVVIGA